MSAGVLLWILGWNVAAFCLMGVDKWKAKHGRWRLPEKVLFLSALAGGSVGALLGMGFLPPQDPPLDLSPGDAGHSDPASGGPDGLDILGCFPPIGGGPAPGGQSAQAQPLPAVIFPQSHYLTGGRNCAKIRDCDELFLTGKIRRNGKHGAGSRRPGKGRDRAMLTDLKSAKKVTGAKQVTRALKNGTAPPGSFWPKTPTPG